MGTTQTIPGPLQGVVCGRGVGRRFGAISSSGAGGRCGGGGRVGMVLTGGGGGGGGA